jgi:hypothetical protein
MRCGGRAYDRPAARCQGGLRPRAHFAYAASMSETQDEKKARLAQALRDNLRRRKAQAREGIAPPPAQKGKD